MLLICEAVEAGSSVDKDCRDVATFAMFLGRHGGMLLFQQFFTTSKLSAEDYESIESAQCIGALVAFESLLV